MVSSFDTHILEPHSFVEAEWRPAEPAVASTPVPLKLLTWNVWFGNHARQARYKALLAELSRRSPDVIVLQEVTRGLLAAIAEAPWVRRRYQISDINGSTLGPYGVLLLSRIPIRRLVMLELPTEMGRSLLIAELACGLTAQSCRRATEATRTRSAGTAIAERKYA